MDFVGFAEGAPKFFSDGASRIYFKFLGEVGDVEAGGANDFACGGFDFAGDDFELGGFAGTVNAY